MRWLPDLVIVGLLAVVAAMVRLLWLPDVVDGDVWWTFPDDPPAHLRRALLTMAHWPSTPTFDPYVNYPDHGLLYWPPGLAWLTAGLARTFYGTTPDPLAVEWVASWLPPVVGGLVAPATYGLARTVAGRGRALAAATLAGIAPSAVQAMVPGRLDHHFLEPLLVLGVAAGVIVGARGRRWPWAVLGGVTIGVAFLTWPGVLLHLGALCAAVLLAALLLGERGAALSVSGARTFAVGVFAAIPAVALSPWRDTAVFYAPSSLHLLLLALGALSLWAAAQPDDTPLIGALPRVARFLVGPAVALLCLAVGPVRDAVIAGSQYTAGSPFVAFVNESGGVLSDPRLLMERATLPVLASILVAPTLLRKTSARLPEGGVVIALISLVFFGLALLGRRWLAPWVPFGAIVVVLALPAPAPRRLATLTLTPSLLALSRLQVLGVGERAGQRFLQHVAEVVPPASADSLDLEEAPAFGMVTPWWLGHLATWETGLPTLGNNYFGTPWYDASNVATLTLYLEEDCEKAAAWLSARRLRYVLVTLDSADIGAGLRRDAEVAGLDPDRYADADNQLVAGAQRALVMRLGPRDGESFPLPTGAFAPACGRFRLVTEGRMSPEGTGPGEVKLFEVVPGAVLQGAAPPNAQITAMLPVTTTLGRTFVWGSVTTANPDGRWTLTVPYRGDAWQVRSAAGFARVAVSEAEIRTGARIEVGLTPSAAR